MAYEDLSGKQLEILNFIKQHICEKGVPPSVREICLAVELKSTSSVHSHLSSLERKGYIKREGAKSRCIGLSEECSDVLPAIRSMTVPIIERVKDGLPLFSPENISGYFPIPYKDSPPDSFFMFRANDDSLKDFGIRRGDLVIIRSEAPTSDDDVVIVSENEALVLKQYSKVKNPILNLSEPVFSGPGTDNRCRLLGKATGLYRIFEGE